MDHLIQSGQGADALAAKLLDGDLLQFGAGSFNNGATIQAKNHCNISGDPSHAAQITVAGGHDGVFVSRYVGGASLSDLTFQTVSKASAACSISGSDCTINGLTQIGAGRVLTFNSAQRLTADMLISTNGLMEDYGIWAGLDGLQPPHGPIDCRLARFDLTMLLGMHGIRIHKHTNLVLGDANLSLPGFNFAGRVKYHSPYRGAAITLKEGSNAKVIRVWTDGPVGVGPNQAELGNAGWEQLRTDGTLFSGCEFNVQDRFFALGAGAINTRVETSIIRAQAGFACLSIGGPWKAWPAATGVFDNVQFFGSSLCGQSNRPYLAGFTFTSCTLNGNPLSSNGDVIQTKGS